MDAGIINVFKTYYYVSRSHIDASIHWNMLSWNERTGRKGIKCKVSGEAVNVTQPRHSSGGLYQEPGSLFKWLSIPHEMLLKCLLSTLSLNTLNI